MIANNEVDSLSDVDGFVAVESNDMQLLNETRLTEEIAHHLSYKKAVDTVKTPKTEKPRFFSLLEEDNVRRSYYVVPLRTNSGKIVADMYIPTDTNNSRVYVNFQGTVNTAGVLADLEYCPGEETFQRHKKTIMAGINQEIGEVAKACGRPVELVFTGHSLGGALAQQCQAEAMRYQATNIYEDQMRQDHPDMDTTSKIIDAERAYQAGFAARYPGLTQPLAGMPNGIAANERQHYATVGRMKLLAINSAGVSHLVENLSNQTAEVLAKHGTQTAARYTMIGGDGIQMTGEGSILSDAPRADVSVVKLHAGQGNFQQTIQDALKIGAAGFVSGAVLGLPGAVVGGMIGFAGSCARSTALAHCSSHFEESHLPQHVRVETYKNNTPSNLEIVKKKLQNKSQALQSAVLMKAKSVLHYFGSKIGHVRKACRPAAQPAETVVRPLPSVRVF